MIQLSATEILTCAICEGPIEVTEWGWNQGHNAAPVIDGRCCNICQDTVVMPARLGDRFGLKKGHEMALALRIFRNRMNEEE